MYQDYNNDRSDQSNKQNQSGYGQQGCGNPYGTQGNPYGNPYGTQGNPYGSPYDQYRPPIYFQAGPDDNARSCHTMGLLAVICLFFSQVLSIIFGVIALSYAKKSFNALGYECPEMKSGRRMGKIGIIAGSVLTGIVFLFYIIVVIVSIAAAI